MRHHAAPLLLLLALAMGCSRASRPDASPTDTHTDTPAADYVIGQGEVRTIEGEPLGPPTYTDVQPGYAVFAVGGQRVLLGREPGRYEVLLPTPASGEPKAVTLEVTKDASADPGVPAEVFTNLGVGQEVNVSGEGITFAHALDPTHVIANARASRRAVDVHVRSPGRHDVVAWSTRGPRHLVFEVLPEGELPDGAQVETLTLGSPGHELALVDVVKVSLHDPEVVRVRVTSDREAVVEPIGAGLSAVNITPREGVTRTIWFRVRPAD